MLGAYKFNYSLNATAVKFVTQLFSIFSHRTAVCRNWFTPNRNSKFDENVKYDELKNIFEKNLTNKKSN